MKNALRVSQTIKQAFAENLKVILVKAMRDSQPVQRLKEKNANTLIKHWHIMANAKQAFTLPL